MKKSVALADLSDAHREQYEIAQSFDGVFSTDEFTSQYLEQFPDRNPPSMLPGDFSFNETQRAGDKYPSFLLTVAPSQYRFVDLDYQSRDTARCIGDLSRVQFDQVFDNLNKNLCAYNGSEFDGFQLGVIYKWESYKDDIQRIALDRLNSSDWVTTDIGSGRILEALIHAIEIRTSAGAFNNLVAWEPRPNRPSSTAQLRQGLRNGPKRNQFEQVLFNLFRGQIDHEIALTRIVDLVGARYPLIAYIFFLIDYTQYMPIAPQTFDRAFAELGIDLRTSGKCSWENYAAYNEAIGWVREALIEWKGFAGTRLLDAHSWVWLMARLPGKIELQEKQGVSKPDDIQFRMIELGRSIISRAASANGQTEKSVVKNKEVFGFSSEQALYDFLGNLWERQQGLCNLTGLPMQLRVGKGAPNHMTVSVDRISSDGHYSPDNLQLTCWFANRWKGTTPHDEFMELLSRVQTGPLEDTAVEGSFADSLGSPSDLLSDEGLR